MYTSNLENQLVFVDIADIMQQYVSIQPDIDETRIKAACIIAQSVDVERIIGEDNLKRVIEVDGIELEGADIELRKLLEAPISYYTYSRLLLSFHGNYTDSGYTNEEAVATRNEAKSVSKEMKSVAETFMQKVINFLEEEDPNTEADETKLTPRVRVFGGVETRGSN